MGTIHQHGGNPLGRLPLPLPPFLLLRPDLVPPSLPAGLYLQDNADRLCGFTLANYTVFRKKQTCSDSLGWLIVPSLDGRGHPVLLRVLSSLLWPLSLDRRGGQISEMEGYVGFDHSQILNSHVIIFVEIYIYF